MVVFEQITYENPNFQSFELKSIKQSRLVYKLKEEMYLSGVIFNSAFEFHITIHMIELSLLFIIIISFTLINK